MGDDEESAEARGVFEHRMFHLACTLDKVKYFLCENQEIHPPMREMTDAEVAEKLWDGKNSIAEQIKRAAIRSLAPDSDASSFSIVGNQLDAVDPDKIDRILTLFDSAPPAGSKQSAKRSLKEFGRLLRSFGGKHIAAADVAHLFGSTERFFQCVGHSPVTSEPVDLTNDDRVKQSANRPMPKQPKRKEDPLRKPYRRHFVWSQLSHWHKHTVYDVQASLWDHVKATLGMPDPSSAYSAKRTVLSSEEREGAFQRLASDGAWPKRLPFSVSIAGASPMLCHPFLDAALSRWDGSHPGASAQSVLDELVSLQ